jgi:hypothetical protein
LKWSRAGGGARELHLSTVVEVLKRKSASQTSRKQISSKPKSRSLPPVICRMAKVNVPFSEALVHVMECWVHAPELTEKTALGSTQNTIDGHPEVERCWVNPRHPKRKAIGFASTHVYGLSPYICCRSRVTVDYQKLTQWTVAVSMVIEICRPARAFVGKLWQHAMGIHQTSATQGKRTKANIPKGETSRW